MKYSQLYSIKQFYTHLLFTLGILFWGGQSTLLIARQTSSNSQNKKHIQKNNRRPKKQQVFKKYLIITFIGTGLAIGGIVIGLRQMKNQQLTNSNSKNSESKNSQINNKFEQEHKKKLSSNKMEPISRIANSKSGNSTQVFNNPTQLTLIGDTHNSNKGYDQALKYYEKARTIYQKMEEKSDEDYQKYANLLYSMGDAYYYKIAYNETKQNQKVYNEAISCYKKALDIYKNTIGQNNEKYVKLLSDIGFTYKDQREYDQALIYYKTAIDLWKTTFSKETEQLLHYGIARVYYYKQKYDEALAHYTIALTIYEKTVTKNSKKYTRVLQEIGKVYQEQEKYQEALKKYEEALAIYKKLGGKESPEYIRLLKKIEEVNNKNNK